MVKKTNLIYFLLIFIFLNILSVMAQPPFLPESSGDLVISYPQIGTGKVNNEIEFNFHVYNTTSQVTNSTTSCMIHIYDLDGSHLLSDNLNYDLSNEDFYYNYTFVTTGYFPYLVDCNGTEIGHLSTFIEITPSGLSELSQYYWILIIIIAMILALGFWFEEEIILIIGSFGLLFLGFWIIIYGIDFVKNTNFTWPIGLLLWGLAIYIMFRSSIEFLRKSE